MKTNAGTGTPTPPWNVVPVATMCLLASLAPGLGGCSLSEDLYVGKLAQGNRHHELIEHLEQKLDRGEYVPTKRLLFLCGAYYHVRRYDQLLSTSDLMAKQISNGDSNWTGDDLTVYPYQFRAKAYLDLGQYSKAIQEASAAYDLLHQENREKQNLYKSQAIEILGILGVAYSMVGRVDKAREILDLLRRPDLNAEMLRPARSTALARIHIANGEFGKALRQIRSPGAEVGGYLKVWYDTTFQDMPKKFILSKCLYETGHVDEARKHYDQLLGHPRIRQLGGIYWLALFDHARIARADGNVVEAIGLLGQAVDVVEQQRGSITTEAGRIGFVGDKQAVYHELVSVLLTEGRHAEAFEYVERSKARALVDLLASQKKIAAPGADSDRADTMLRRLAKAEHDLRILGDPRDKHGDDRTRGVIVGLKQELSAKAPELASLVTVTNAPAREIQAMLAPDEALLEYYYSDKEFFVFILTREGLAAQKLSRPGLEENARAFREAVSRSRSTDYLRSSQALHGQLIRPTAGLLAGKKLIVVPHGVLHYVPFAALHSGGEYVIDRHSIRVLPSASVMKFLKERQAGAGGLLALGNPDLGKPKLDLPSAQQEAVSIAKMVKGSKVLLRKDATETSVKRQGGRFAMLHFATHGTFRPDRPLNSALLLARDAENDGLLRVAELYSLRLNADLVTLSGCETALGKVANGDDVVGFTRGLLYAGTSSIVSSLWKVPDKATRDLMVDFYGNLSKTDKQEALRQAQLRTKERHPHPYYWAAFVLTGRGV